MRRNWLFLAVFCNLKKTKPHCFSSHVLFRLGYIHFDLAFMDKSTYSANKGAVGFVCCCEIATQRIWATPFKRKTTESMENAIRLLIEESPYDVIGKIFCDR